MKNRPHPLPHPLILHSMNYHLTSKTKYFNDPKTYYDVKKIDVHNTCKFMCTYFNVERIFIYQKSKVQKIGDNPYICCYTAKFDNFRTSDGFLHKTFPG